MIRFACPGCSAMFTVEDAKAGKAGQCPKCQSQFIIPAAPEPGAAEQPLTEAPPPLPLPPPAPIDVPVLSPPPAPPAHGPNDPVEIRPCPQCRSRLSVLPADLDLDIECPTCKTVYQANRADAPPPPSSTGERSGPRGSLVRLGSGSKAEDDRDDDRREKRRSKRRDEDDDRDDDRPRKRRRDDDDEDDDYGPRRRRSRRDDDDDDYGRRLPPHRGGMVLTFGIVGLVFCWTVVGLVFSILAWVFGAQDLRAMDAGRMDDTGRSSTNTGKVLGIVSVVLFLVIIGLRCGLALLRTGLR